jgi:hypothetical protein
MVLQTIVFHRVISIIYVTFSYDFIRKTSRKLRTIQASQRAWVRQESYREWSEADARAKLLIWLLEKNEAPAEGIAGAS